MRLGGEMLVVGLVGGFERGEALALLPLSDSSAEADDDSQVGASEEVGVGGAVLVDVEDRGGLGESSHAQSRWCGVTLTQCVTCKCDGHSPVLCPGQMLGGHFG